MKTQEVVIEIRIPLPEDRVENAKKTIEVDEFEKIVIGTADSTFGADGYGLTSRVVTHVPGRGRQKAENSK